MTESRWRERCRQLQEKNDDLAARLRRAEEGSAQLHRAVDALLLEVVLHWGSDGQLLLPIPRVEQLERWKVRAGREGESYRIRVEERGEELA